MTERIRFSAQRVFLIAGNTWLEAVRQRFFNLLVLLGVGFVFSSLFFREFNFGTSELKFIADFGFGALAFFGAVLAIVGTAQLLFSEIESRTILTLLAKPVLRSEFILGKFLGVAAMLVVFVAVVSVAIAAVLSWREAELTAALGTPGKSGLVALGGVFVFAGLQALKLAIVAAATILIATFARTHLFAVTVSFMVLIICHLQPLAQGVWGRSESWLTRILSGGLAVLFPNFQVFNLGDQVASGRSIALDTAVPVAAYGLGYLAVLLALAIFSFRRREI
jgi:ABC-type transport system involved in multi-copper enzyme maturation permease subunit